MTNIELILTILSVILGGVSLLFTIFTISLGVVIFWGWKSAKDYEKMKKEAEIQYKQATKDFIGNANIEMENFKNQANNIFKKVKNKKGKKYISDQEKRLNDLICKMDKIIERAENKLAAIETSSLSRSSLPIGNTFMVGTPYSTLYGSHIGLGDSSNKLSVKKCTKCGESYLPQGVLDNGKCDKCNNKGDFSGIFTIGNNK